MLCLLYCIVLCIAQHLPQIFCNNASLAWTYLGVGTCVKCAYALSRLLHAHTSCSSATTARTRTSSLTKVFPHTFGPLDVITFVIAFLHCCSSGSAASACQSADTAKTRPALFAHRKSLVLPNNQKRMKEPEHGTAGFGSTAVSLWLRASHRTGATLLP